MTVFSGPDLRRAVAVVESIGGPNRVDPFPHQTLEALGDLVGADTVGYCESPRLIGFGGYELGTRAPPVWLPDALRELGHEDPTHPTLRGNAVRTVAVSDLLGKRDMERLDLYDAVWEPLGVLDSLRLYLGGVGDTCRFFFFDRASRGFPDRGRRLLELLRPMLLRARDGWLPSSDAAAADLSARESEILGWAAVGLTNEEIARRLWLSPHTVRKHLENTYRKLDVHSRTQAASLISRTQTAAAPSRR